MNEASQWSLVVTVLGGYALLLAGLLLWKRTRMWIIGYAGHKPCAHEEPVYLPWAAAGWAVLSAVVLALARDALIEEVTAPAVSPPPPAPDAGGPPSSPAQQLRGMLGSSQHAFFSLGWRTGLAVFGISIDTWPRYTLVCMYQMTRAVLGSLLINVFVPFALFTIQNKDPPSQVASHTARRALLGRALVQVFNTWSALTDVLMSASQIDLALFTLVTTAASDFGYGYYRIHACNFEATRISGGVSPVPKAQDVCQPAEAAPPPVTRVGNRRRGGAHASYGVQLLAVRDVV